MKKILYILSLLIISFGVKGQNKWDVNLKNIGSTQEKALARGGLRTDSSFDPPNRDTSFHPIRAGNFVYFNTHYWSWNGVKWVALIDTITGGPQVNSDWNAVTGVAEILNKPNFATVAFTGSYTDLINQPSIPAAQIKSDWNANTTLAQILNRPRLVDSVYKPTVDSIAIVLRGADNTLRTYKLSVGSSTAAGTVTQLNQGYAIVLTPNPITSVGLVAADTTKIVPYTDTLKPGGIATQTMIINQLSSMSSVDFIIGDGGGSTPVAGTTVYTNAALQHSTIVGVYHEGQKVPNREVRGTIYVTTDTTAGTVTLHNGVFADSTYWSVVYRGPFIPSGTGTNLTLTTTGNTGASTLVGATLNIPNYTITLTHTGTSGNATLVSGTLNIPNYTFTLTNGSGTTASSTAVNLGGTLTQNATITEGSSFFTTFTATGLGSNPTVQITNTFTAPALGVTSNSGIAGNFISNGGTAIQAVALGEFGPVVSATATFTGGATGPVYYGVSQGGGTVGSFVNNGTNTGDDGLDIIVNGGTGIVINTTGNTGIGVNNTSTSSYSFYGNSSNSGAGMLLQTVTGNGLTIFTGSGGGTSSPGEPLSFTMNTNSNAGTIYPATTYALAGPAAPSVGIGQQFDWVLPNTSPGQSTAMRQTVVATNVANATYEATWQVSLDHIGSLQPVLTIAGNGTVTLTAIQNFANNAAAITGGLTTGQLYRNGDAVQIVH